MRRLVVIISLVAAQGVFSSAATLHTDTFDVDLQGWTGGALPSHQTVGGVDGGYMRLNSDNNMGAYVQRADWLGSYLAIGANEIRVDMMVPTTSPPLEMRILLFGPQSPTSQRWTSADAQLVPNDGVWRNYAFSLAEEALFDLVGNQDYLAMMGNVLRVLLRHDPGEPDYQLFDPIIAELNIDNVQLAAAATALPGDFDGNGMVNAADLTDPVLGWQARFGVDLDGADFLLWQRHLGAGATTSVPEPAGGVLVALAAAAMLRARPRVCRALGPRACQLS